MNTLSDIDKQIAELQAQKQKLIDDEKKNALKKVEDAIKELNALGFNYQLVDGTKKTKTTRTRRSGVRDSVLAEIKKHPGGISRADLMAAMNATDDKAQTSVSNAVAALKKNDEITAEQGHYTAQG
ncbi:hypothetical protein ACGYLM_01405 [Sulfitobacter sp. 1A10445]|uniref:hypothetical protein n=1 Tax=unclassified Sulfitobacter TaxID=196795 RepID=UPI0037456856